MREHLPLPQKIQNAPELQLGLGLYFGAFFDLNSCRQNGMGVGQIPWTAVQDYCEHLGLSDEQTADMHSHIRDMDQAFLKYCDSKKES